MHDQAARALVPSVSTLDDPALGQNDKAAGISFEGEQIRLLGMRPSTDVPVCRVAHDLDLQIMPLRDRLRTLSGVAAVDVERRNTRVLVHRCIDDWMGAIAILHARGGNDHRQQESKRIDEDVALAPLDLLAGVVATLTALGRATC